MDQIPDSIEYVVIGAGIHGLSSAWHLAMELEARGQGSAAGISSCWISRASARVPQRLRVAVYAIST